MSNIDTACAVLLLRRIYSKLGKMQYRSNPQRMALTVVYIIQFFTKATWAQAHKLAQKNPEVSQHLPAVLSKSDQAQSRRVGKKFMQEATVHNLPHTKKVKTHDLRNSITDSQYNMAAFVLKSGYMEQQRFTNCFGEEEEQEVHTYYTSLGAALERDESLRDIYNKAVEYDSTTTHHSFMQCLYRCDPCLQSHRVHIKMAMDEELRERRRTRATSLLQQLQKNPKLLEQLFFIDECAISFDHAIKRGVLVYCDAHDKGYRFVIPYKGAEKIKVKIMGAVNFHTGAVWFEFTTGTTNLHRRHNTPESPANTVYLVSLCHCHVTCYSR
jgi:hypothetical protein